jgi:hypothetical protein
LVAGLLACFRSAYAHAAPQPLQSIVSVDSRYGDIVSFLGELWIDVDTAAMSGMLMLADIARGDKKMKMHCRPQHSTNRRSGRHPQ